jgi:meso-butanediol dehydrogenase/(S,S)-butanediol dehydrogenase/diacetyl reductase
MGKIALVTGSTNNVGKRIAEKLSGDGFLVIVVSRHGDEAKAVAEGLVKKGGFYTLDLSDPEQIAGLFAFIKET